ncbi:unnamed protein product [Phytophthora fragariaefolia]|uniref:Unnamed protein product n=1 Tax=Phytophthora fragariaefolia TaxID=1490495 RepID=A0A9W6Y6A6_9STRA|nr:unnamed protein product [Phytophthora fragariaefolia]
MWEATQVELHGSYSTARVTDLAKGYSEQQTVLGAGVLLLRGDDVPRYPPVPHRGTDSAVVPYKKSYTRYARGIGADGWRSVRGNLVDWLPCTLHNADSCGAMVDDDDSTHGNSMGKRPLKKSKGSDDAHRHGQVVAVRLSAGIHLPALFMRNLFGRAVGHLGDETPGFVIFNADVFGSLFIAYCMQSSPSFEATLELMVVDILLMWLSLRDIEKARKGLSELERKVDDNAMWSSYHGAVGHISLGGRMPTTLERASILLEREAQSHVGGSRSSQLLELQRVLSHEKQEREGPKLVALEGRKSLNKSIIMMMKDIRNSLRRIYPTDHEVRGVVKELKGDERATGSRTLKPPHTNARQRGVLLHAPICIAAAGGLHAPARAGSPATSSDCLCAGEAGRLRADQPGLLAVVRCPELAAAPGYVSSSLAKRKRRILPLNLRFLRGPGYDYSFQFAWLSSSSASTSSESGAST